MKEFVQAKKLAHVSYDVRGPVVDEAARMEENGEKILKLNIGNPAPFGFRPPEKMVEVMKDSIMDVSGYSVSKGMLETRMAVKRYAESKGIPNVDVNEIYTGNGASELITMALNALLDSGDEVLIPSPDYPLWTASANLAGGKAVHYICDESSDWYPDLDDIESKITDRTKGIVLINPNNPTGALYNKDLLERVVDICRRHELILFSDEIYDRLVMDGEEHISTASLAPDLFCVTFGGLSKSHMACGYRIGWMILSGNKEVAKDYIAGLNLLSSMRLCSNVPAQAIVKCALEDTPEAKNVVLPGGRIFEQRNYVWQALNDIPGISAVKPKAAFYIFPKIDAKKFNITNDVQFAMDFLHEKKVLIIPASGFNYPTPDHFRVVFLPEIDVLKESMDNLADFLKTYRQ